jgi:NADH-ubiquinone oxidoreductase chain 1
MSVCWTIFLPLIIAYVILIPCVVFGLNILPTSLVL